MIFVRLIGGIGNQMFQYAAARRLAYAAKAAVIFDISHFKYYPGRSYALGHFNIQEQFLSSDEAERFNSEFQSRFKSLIRFLDKKRKRCPRYIKEKYFRFDPAVLRLGDNIYLDGYWQSEKYFIDITSLIKKEFTVTTPEEGRNKELASGIREVNSVSIHIRRGDFVSNPKISKVHGTCGIDYYLRSVDYISQKVDNPRFFIFSDDPEWASQNLKLSYPNTIVKHNGTDKGYEDLRLMSQCKHNIIANSSFSWWGAWLNTNSEKIVVAPRRWFQTRGRDTKDLLPDSWMRL